MLRDWAAMLVDGGGWQAQEKLVPLTAQLKTVRERKKSKGTVSLFTKAERKELRRLSGIAYARELAKELTNLQSRFTVWQHGEIDPFELSDAVHEFHQGPSRDLYKYYTIVDPSMAVARAFVDELLKESEISGAILQKLGPTIDFYRSERKGTWDDQISRSE